MRVHYGLLYVAVYGGCLRCVWVCDFVILLLSGLFGLALGFDFVFLGC